MYRLVFIVIALCHLLHPAASSEGDRSRLYQNCLNSCVKKNCTSDGYYFNTQSSYHQDFWCRMTRWTCKDECKYACMWKTVKVYEVQNGYVPKFHGKWPFKRLMGMQEPASAVSSMLNLASHAYMHRKIRREFSASRMPMVLFWNAFAYVCMNAWMWSTIFHTRDTGFTEFMDYACALSMVMALFVAAVVRIFDIRRKLTAFVLLIPLFYFVTHVQYLYAGRIDYDYNIIVNVVFGVLGSALWLVWSCAQCAAGRRHAWRVIVFTLLAGAALLLEVLDFPPKYNWDAHALWHLNTAPLPLLFYQFVIDDLRWMQSNRATLDLKMA